MKVLPYFKRDGRLYVEEKSSIDIMKKMKSFLILQITIMSFSVISSCTESKVSNTVNTKDTESSLDGYQQEYYPHYETLYFETGKGYEFRNPNSTKLMITLDGGPSWQAQIGKEDKKIEGWRLIDDMLIFYTEYDYNIFVPEIFDWEEDEPLYYWNFIEERERNTFDNVQAGYVEVIGEYLAGREYEAIVIIGFSSGARHLPMVYSKLEASNIDVLVSIAYGGLSAYEKSEIMLAKQQAGVAPYEEKENWENLLAGLKLKMVLDYSHEEPRNDSVDRFWGRDVLTYRWLNSIMEERPFDYYENINIPVLFIHGEMDMNVPVESTKYVEENLPGKSFDYIYYPEMAHASASREELYRLRNDIKDWLISKGF